MSGPSNAAGDNSGNTGTAADQGGQDEQVASINQEVEQPIDGQQKEASVDTGGEEDSMSEDEIQGGHPPPQPIFRRRR